MTRDSIRPASGYGDRAIAHLLRHETGGDPKMVPPRHRKNRRPSADSGPRQYRTSLVETDGIQLAGESQAAGIGKQEPAATTERNRQFTYIDRQRKRFTARAHPIISVDAKKKEWIGKFKNSGISWEQQPQLVNDHDFPSDAVGRAIPYGVYDSRRNQGFVGVGTSRETPAFAVDAITLWWKSCGQKRYPKAKELLILADSSGGNSARARGWKYHLQRQLVNPTDCRSPSVTILQGLPNGTPSNIACFRRSATIGRVALCRATRISASRSERN